MGKVNLLNVLGKLGLSKTSDGSTKTSGGLKTFIEGLKEKVKVFGKTESNKVVDTFHKLQDKAVDFVKGAADATDETNKTMPWIRGLAIVAIVVLGFFGIKHFTKKGSSSYIRRK